jgi:hypothetical protein
MAAGLITLASNFPVEETIDRLSDAAIKAGLGSSPGWTTPTAPRT